MSCLELEELNYAIHHLGMQFPYSYASTWANLRKCFANFYKGDFYKGSSSSNGSTNRLPGLQTMLDMLGMYYLTIFGLEDDLATMMDPTNGS